MLNPKKVSETMIHWYSISCFRINCVIFIENLHNISGPGVATFFSPKPQQAVFQRPVAALFSFGKGHFDSNFQTLLETLQRSGVIV